MWPATEVRAGTPTLSRATPGVGDGRSVWVVLSVVEDAEAQPATLAWRMGSQMAITVATTRATMRLTSCIMNSKASVVKCSARPYSKVQQLLAFAFCGNPVLR